MKIHVQSLHKNRLFAGWDGKKQIKMVNFKSLLFCTTTGYFLHFFSSLPKKEGGRKGE